jgi:site-specific DNA-methyltransferase (adenine-specific)
LFTEGKNMKVTMKKLSEIRPYPNNPRINQQAVAAVAASIQEFGWRQPIVTDETGEIIVGHTRYLAALELRLETVPVHVAEGLTPAQIKGYRIADNKTAELAYWDNDRLAQELAGLEGMDFDLDLLGFEADELTRLLGEELTAGLVDPDDIPMPPDEPITQPGDLWLLGTHRLLCADSGHTEDVVLLPEINITFSR